MGYVLGAVGRALFAGTLTPSLMILKLLLSFEAERDVTIILLDVKCAFLYGSMRRHAYVALPQEEPPHGHGGTLGKLKKATHGAHDAPQFPADTVKVEMNALGFKAIHLHPSFCLQA